MLRINISITERITIYEHLLRFIFLIHQNRKCVRTQKSLHIYNRYKTILLRTLSPVKWFIIYRIYIVSTQLFNEVCIPNRRQITVYDLVDKATKAVTSFVYLDTCIRFKKHTSGLTYFSDRKWIKGTTYIWNLLSAVPIWVNVWEISKNTSWNIYHRNRNLQRNYFAIKIISNLVIFTMQLSIKTLI